MRNTRIKKALFSLLIILLFMNLSIAKVNGEEVVEEENVSEIAKQFEEKYLPIIVNYGSSLLGTITTLIILFLNIKKKFKELGQAKSDVEKGLSDSKNILAETTDLLNNIITDLKAVGVSFNETKEDIYGKLENSLEQVETAENNVLEIYKDRKELNENIENIKEALRIAFVNNPNLVSNGKAVEINRTLTKINGEEKKESDTSV